MRLGRICTAPPATNRPNPKTENRKPKEIRIPKTELSPLRPDSSPPTEGLVRFVLPKLHAKWLQYFVARNDFLDFLWAYFSAARPHIYKHLRKQEHWHCGTRRPRVSRNCDSGRWRSFVSFWFWLCQVRISVFGLPSGFGPRVSDFRPLRLVVLTRYAHAAPNPDYPLAAHHHSKRAWLQTA
jgi:hypothetical protein